MTNKNIENIYFNNNGISALYQGTNLIWKKQEVVTDGYIIGYANKPPGFVTCLINNELYGGNIEDGIYRIDFKGECLSLYNMFQFKTNITLVNLANFYYSSCTNFGRMFFTCTSLTDIVFNPQCTISNADDIKNMFISCTSLTDVRGAIEGIKLDLDLSDSPLTADSAMVFINGLEEVEETKTLSLKDTTYDSLTEEQIAIATSKGWTVTRS